MQTLVTSSHPLILHIAPAGRWAEQRSSGAAGYVDGSLEDEGFIHCSTVDQFLLPANSLFRGRTDLLLLVVAAARLSSPLVYEDCYQSGQQFPHVYGPIDVAAVVDAVDFPCDDDGSFSEPPGLRDHLARLAAELA